jgi:hypothetical protein
MRSSGAIRGRGAGRQEAVALQKAMQQPARQEAQEGYNERQ